MLKQLCFVLMPFGKKPDAAGAIIDFDAVYRKVIRPAIDAAGLEPLRADEEEGGGIIHKPMFERLILCPFAVADLTTANANVFYELGVRHSVRPATTVLVYGGGSRLPFDVQPLRALKYVVEANGLPERPEVSAQAITKRLLEAISDQGSKDSPLYQLLEDYPNIQHEKTDVFRKQVAYNRERKNELQVARNTKLVESVQVVEDSLGSMHTVDPGVAIDLLLSYRDLKGWENMVNLISKLSPELGRTVLVQEQYGFAMNRLATQYLREGEKLKSIETSLKAESILTSLIKTRGPSSETCGILGRIYKDRWEQALREGDIPLSQGLLDQAIATYLMGFETDWRDAYPGVNAVTLMTVRSEQDASTKALLPVVRYSVERRIAQGQPDYWDWATMVELAVLQQDQHTAENSFSKALTKITAYWEPETTAKNLRLLRESRAQRGHILSWATAIEDYLNVKAKALT